MVNEKTSILLVDDKEQGLKALEVVLEGQGYNLILARSGSEALTQLLNTEVAVILMDVQMPDMDGFETATYIKKREKTSSVPIIFVTGVDKDERFVTHGYETGAVDYLFKPYDPQILRSKIAVFVELFEQNRKIKSQTEELAKIQLQEQMRRLEQLELQSRIRYRNLADAIPHIVWKADADFSVDYFNKTWTEYTGLSSEKSSGAGWMTAFAKEDLPPFMGAWESAKKNKKSFEIESRILRSSDETFRWHLIKVVAEEASEQGVLSWLITCTEIHVLKETENQLKKAKQEADKANTAKSFFLANMSHEIRTPLGAIMGFSDLLMDRNISDNQRISHTEVIRRNGDQLLRIIDEILDISKIESESLVLSKEKIAMKNFVRSLKNTLSLQASRKGIDVEFSIVGEVPEYFMTDITRARQVLINIIGNAVKFTSKGSVKVSISYSLKKELISFAVTDTGPGIDNIYIDSLFRPFSQGDSSTSRRFGGTGLGLALSRKLARALGGDLILVKTELGSGSTFTASLSVGTQEEISFIQTLKDQLDDSEKKILKEKASRKELEGQQILVADDLLDNQLLLKTLLRKAGATVEVANNGEEAIEKALGGKYNLILMDIQMPKLDGYQATQILRSKGYKQPIIAVTAHAMIEEKERCLSKGCTGYLSKPFNHSLLVREVADYCKKFKIVSFQ